ncbi:MAG: M15 family metallopeptidase [Alistipes sp.]|nr:M15 family metallopeptidase [Alistipes sp.]
MQEYGLVDIQSLDDEILIDLKYSSTDNFVGVDMYGDLNEAYLEAEFASKVVRAQKILKQRHPQYTLLIYDAARPISVQRAMRRIVEGTPFEGFVADGTRGGRHNYGVAVDLTIATLNGTPLDMGAGFDDFTDAASVKGTPDNSDPTTRTVEVYRKYINSLCDQGLISRVAAQNRILLIEVMHAAGLYPYRREWWHFEEIISITATREKYQLLDF